MNEELKTITPEIANKIITRLATGTEKDEIVWEDMGTDEKGVQTRKYNNFAFRSTYFVGVNIYTARKLYKLKYKDVTIAYCETPFSIHEAVNEVNQLSPLIAAFVSLAEREEEAEKKKQEQILLFQTKELLEWVADEQETTDTRKFS